MRNKKAKSLYDKLRYRKKKLISIMEKLEKHKNIYNNTTRNKIANYTKKQIEEIYKKAVFDKDKQQQKKLMQLAEEYKGGFAKIQENFIQNLQKDLEANIYGNDKGHLNTIAKNDLANFRTLMEGLTAEQKAEFLNSNQYYGARRYQKPPAESQAFLMQVEQDGASYIVDNLRKYYEDKGLPLPQLKEVITERGKKIRDTRAANLKKKLEQ